MPRVGSSPALVVGVDGSDNSWGALDWAVEEAARRDSRVRMIHAYERPGFRRRVDPHLNMVEMYEEGKAVFAAARAHLAGGRHADRLVGTALHEGSPSQVLVDLAANAPTCVVGRRGRGRLASFALGSTSLTLAVRTQVPLVVVPPDWDPRGDRGSSRDEAGARPVLVGLDLTTSGRTALAYAFEAARAASAPLVALCAWELPDMSGASWPVPRTRPAGRIEAGRALADRLAPWRATYPDVRLTPLVQENHPVAALVDNARTAQLLVLGGRTYPTTGVVTGTVSRSVLKQASCPVAVVPEPGPPKLVRV